MPHSNLAVVFDFDETLTPDSTSKFLAGRGVDVDKFWNSDVKALVEDGYDSTLAWLNLFLEMVGEGKPLGGLTTGDLRAFGATLDDDFALGLPELFDDLKKIVAEYRDISIEFYVVSGGLEEIIRGSEIASRHMTEIYGCLLGEDPHTGQLTRIKRCITFTEKTRYLFEINKGLDSTQTKKNPHMVNKSVPQEQRRVPFENMIYIGDGLTDIPCFSLVRGSKGITFGVFDPAKEKSARRALLEFLQPGRVVGMHKPLYRREDELGSLLRTAVGERCARIVVERSQS